MLHFFRRLRGPILIGITIIIVVTFSWWGGSRNDTMGMGRAREAHDTAFTLYDKAYTHYDLEKLNRLQALCYYRLGLFEFAFGLPDAAKQIQSLERGGPNYDFAGNLLVLRQKAVEYGVAATDADAKKRLETVQSFQKDGKFDENTAAEQIKQLNDAGFSNQDILDLMKDVIAYERLQEIVGANYSASPLAASKAYASNHQTIKATSLSLALEDFKKKVEVKDEEISKAFEEKKETYQTAEKRAASYVLFTKPDAGDATKVAEDKVKAQAAYETLVNEFDMKVRAPGADFAAVVAEFQKKNPSVKLQTLPAFEEGTPPEAIKDEAAVLKELFRTTLTVGQNSAPVNGTKGYYFLKLTQLDAPKQQELKDVKDKVKESIVAQKAQEAIMKAANDARTAVLDGLKGGKKLDDLAKTAALKVESLPEFSPNNPPPDNKLIGLIAQDAAKTATNGATKPVTTETGVAFAVVNHKELRKSDQSTSLKQSEETAQASTAKTEMFKAWFGKLRTEANMQVVQ